MADPTTHGRRKPLKLRGGASTAPCESPLQGAKDKANEKSPLSWPNAFLCLLLRWCIHPSLTLMAHSSPPPAAARAGAGIIDVTWGGQMMMMVPPLPLRVVLEARQQVWS